MRHADSTDMTSTAPLAQDPLAPTLLASACMLMVGGVAVLAVSAIIEADGWIPVVSGLIGASVTLLVFVVLLRFRRARMVARVYDHLEVADGSTRRTPDHATRAGLLSGLAGLAGGLAVFALEDLVLDLEAPGVLAGTVILAIGLVQLLSLRELRRWQDENGLEVCTRAGARRLAWTTAQRRARLVVVRTAPWPAS